ncbi:hypothetical protein COO60DRAFT_1217675 [Scenedesmus sp. NREL 46B-D3]|nr:hypothetical protein COO60DRAFT_1217675 [Scenedesmus sp. NREL 46B-D3]
MSATMQRLEPLAPHHTGARPCTSAAASPCSGSSNPVADAQRTHRATCACPELSAPCCEPIGNIEQCRAHRGRGVCALAYAAHVLLSAFRATCQLLTLQCRPGPRSGSQRARCHARLSPRRGTHCQTTRAPPPQAGAQLLPLLLLPSLPLPARRGTIPPHRCPCSGCCCRLRRWSQPGTAAKPTRRQAAPKGVNHGSRRAAAPGAASAAPPAAASLLTSSPATPAARPAAVSMGSPGCAPEPCGTAAEASCAGWAGTLPIPPLRLLLLLRLLLDPAECSSRIAGSARGTPSCCCCGCCCCCCWVCCGGCPGTCCCCWNEAAPCAVLAAVLPDGTMCISCGCASSRAVQKLPAALPTSPLLPLLLPGGARAAASAARGRAKVSSA